MLALGRRAQTSMVSRSIAYSSLLRGALRNVYVRTGCAMGPVALHTRKAIVRLRQCRSVACSRTADCQPRDGAEEKTRRRLHRRSPSSIESCIFAHEVVDDEPTPPFFHA